MQACPEAVRKDTFAAFVSELKAAEQKAAKSTAEAAEADFRYPAPLSAENIFSEALHSHAREQQSHSWCCTIYFRGNCRPRCHTYCFFLERVGKLRLFTMGRRASFMECLCGDCRSLLAESGINGSSRWSKYKDLLAKDRRYKAVERDARERLFRDFVAEQKVNSCS